MAMAFEGERQDILKEVRRRETGKDREVRCWSVVNAFISTIFVLSDVYHCFVQGHLLGKSVHC